MDTEELERLESLAFEPSGAMVEGVCYDIYYDGKFNELYATPHNRFRPIMATVKVDAGLDLDDNLDNIVKQIRLSLYE